MKLLRYKLLDCTILYFFQTHKIGASLSILSSLIDFTGFWVFNLILHVRYMLTRKIIRFYELTRDFDNIACGYSLLSLFESLWHGNWCCIDMLMHKSRCLFKRVFVLKSCLLEWAQTSYRLTQFSFWHNDNIIY
jgi:hypothetical protein